MTSSIFFKESRINWIGRIPQDWSVLAIKRLSRVRRGSSPRPINAPEYFDNEGAYAWVRISDVTASNGSLTSTTQRLSNLGASYSVKLSPGDLFLSIAGSVGKSCITEIKCCIHDGFVYFPEYKGDKKFLFYIFESGEAYGGLGKLGTQLNLNTDTVGWMQIPYPPLETQKSIARFLDRKTAAIDTLIAKKQRLIQLLEEKRTALINQAVTKGLNPNAPMKDSGIPWIGEIPEHWEVKTVGNISQVVRGASPRPAGNPMYFDGDAYPWITVGEITKDSKMHLTSTESFLTKLGCEQSRLIPKGTLLLTNSGATLGVPKITLINGCINDGSVALFDISDKVEKEFLYFVFTSMTKLLRDRLYQGSGQPNLNTDLVKAIRFSCPPVEEQVKIITYLEIQLDKDSDILERQFESIEKL